MVEHEEFIKTSIHNHFGDKNSEKKLDEDYDKNITMNYNEVIKRLKDAYSNNYQLLGLTNSNTFMVKDYISIKVLAKKYNINIIPGIEVNISNWSNKKYLHTVVLFDPNGDLLKIQEEIKKHITSNQENSISVEQLVDIIIKTRVIIIPHGIKQSGTNRSASKNDEQFRELIAIDDAIPVIIEDNRSFHKKTLINELKEKLSGSDIAWLEKSENISSADRESYSKVISPSYIWGNNSFDDLYYASLIKSNRIKREEDIITKPTYISRIDITPKSKSAQIEQCSLKCSHGLNSIIGQSGSGKTLLLNAIKLKLTGEKLNNNSSGLSTYDSIYEDLIIDLYDLEGNKISPESNWKVYEGENLYNKILTAYSGDKNDILKELKIQIDKKRFQKIISDFSSQITEYKNNLIEINRITIKINETISSMNSNIKFINENANTNESITYLKNESNSTNKLKLLNNINSYKTDLKSINNIKEILTKLDKKYSMDNSQDIDNLLNKYIEKINEIMKNNILQELELKKIITIENSIYVIIKNYNSALGKKGEALLQRKQEILTQIETIKTKIQELIALKRKLKIIPLNKKIFENSLSISKNNFSKIQISTKSLRYNNSELSDLFDANIGGARNKINSTEFKDIKLNLCDEKSIIEFIKIFVKKEYENNIIMSSDNSLYLDYELQLKNSNGLYQNIESMSAGELGKTYISNMIDLEIQNKGANVIIVFDQPENNLEKKFILDNLSKKINELRNHYQVFITTHEPLLVVNADSNNIIQSINDKSAVSKKNNIRYSKLSFIKDSKTKNEMVERIAELVDGSHEAVKERDRIYGGMLNDNKS